MNRWPHSMLLPELMMMMMIGGVHVAFFFAPATDYDYGCEVVLVITIARVQITQGATFSTSTIKDRKPGT